VGELSVYVGVNVGFTDGAKVGVADGNGDGFPFTNVGDDVGTPDGSPVGVPGTTVGRKVGKSDGNDVGTVVGAGVVFPGK